MNPAAAMKQLQKAVECASQGRLKEARAACQKALKADPENPNALNLSGVVELQLGYPAVALPLLRRAAVKLAAVPDVHKNLALAQDALGNLDAAVASLRQAHGLAPGDANIALLLAERLVRLRAFDEAAAVCRATLDGQPYHAGLYHALGAALKAAGRMDEAEEALRRAFECDPSNIAVGLDLAALLRMIGKRGEAADALLRLLRDAPENPVLHAELGRLWLDHPEHGAAGREHLCRAVALAPERPEPLSVLAAHCETRNRLDEAAELAEAALSLAPGDAAARLAAARIARRQGQLEQALALLDGIGAPRLENAHSLLAHFERGRVHERQGRAADAFRCFAEAKGLLIESGSYLDVPSYLEELEGLLQRQPQPSRSAPVAVAGEASKQAAPVLLVGFPRSGTTLLDTMLGGHPRIVVLEEQPFLREVREAIEASGVDYPGGLQDLSDEQLDRLRGDYLCKAHRAAAGSEDRLLLDKHPLHLTDLPLAAALFPGIKVIFIERHPCDVCLSCFGQSFRAYPLLKSFATLTDTARTYDAYMRLWRSYQERLPLDVHRLSYEALVERPEETLRSVVSFLGLPWREQLLRHTDHAESRGKIDTASYAQVVQPIYHTSRNRWELYRPQFAEALPILAPWVEAQLHRYSN